jgi:hypothetical protein
MVLKDQIMIGKAKDHKNAFAVLAITLILCVLIAFGLTGGFFLSKSWISSDTKFVQVPREASLPVDIVSINATNTLNETKSAVKNSFILSTTSSIVLENAKFNENNYGGYSIQPPDLSHLYFSVPDNTSQDQTTSLEDPTLPNSSGTNEIDITCVNNLYNDGFSAPPSSELTSLNPSSFSTYTYGGYSVEQTNLNQFIFTFPDSTNQGQISGSDALSLNAYPIQEVEFDAAFVAPRLTALGFDEMAIFLASNTANYKGTEFGIRMGLNNGFIYGYIQEPCGDGGDVDFQMLPLTLNDGMLHHYTLVTSGSNISFFVDGVDYGYLAFPSCNDYSSLSFSVLAVVHRFSDNWDSYGDSLVAGSFYLE